MEIYFHNKRKHTFDVVLCQNFTLLTFFELRKGDITEMIIADGIFAE